MKTYQVKLSSVEDIKQLVNIVSKYGYEVGLQRDDYEVNAKSIMGVLSLGLNSPLTLIANTDNATELKSEISDYLV